MTDIVQIIIQIQKKQPEIKTLKGLTKFVYENLNPRKMSYDNYGVKGSEIVDFLMMYGLEREVADALLEHMCAQALLKRFPINTCGLTGYIPYFQVHALNFQD